GAADTAASVRVGDRRAGTSTYSTLSASLGRTRPAAQAGPPARRFATRSVAGTTRSTAPTGTIEGETLPTLSATSRHVQRPSATPPGTPTATATTASAVACQATVAITWRRTKPM